MSNETNETVIALLERIVRDANLIYVRVKNQDDRWETLALTEVRDQADVARAVIGWLGKYLEQKQEKTE